MPTHHGSRTKVSLVVADLDSTTTKDPENRRGHGEMAKAALDRGENNMKNGRMLKESFIPLGGDSNPLHFLGQDGAYMPFMMVRAGKELRQNPAVQVFDPNPARNAIFARFLGQSPDEAIHSPHALGIRLDISEQSFLKTNRPMEDVKIDVLFNGQFTNATTAPARVAKEKKTFVFGGKRTHYMLERPWVILPRDKNADGTQRFDIKTETPQERWQQLSQAVAEEAHLRGGRTPVVEYLHALSKLPMPPELDKWDERDTHKYSVIDIVLSYGHGGKDGASTPYLAKPTRLRQRVRLEAAELDEHKTISDVEICKNDNIITSSQQLPKFLTGAIEKAGYYPTTAEQAGRWATASTMLRDVLGRSTLLPRGLPPPMSPPRSSVYTQSRLRKVPDDRVTRSGNHRASLAMPPPLSPLKTAKDFDEPFTRVVFKLGKTHLLTLQLGQPPCRLSTLGKDLAMRATPTLPDMPTHNVPYNAPYTLFPNPYTTPALASPFATGPASTGRPITTAARQAEYEASFREFVTPPLSRDAAVSYTAVRPAYQGTQWMQGMDRGAGGGVVRQIRTERGGEFREEGILVGVRFIVV